MYLYVFAGQLLLGVVSFTGFDENFDVVTLEVLDACLHRLLVGCGHDEEVIVFVCDLSGLVVHVFFLRLSLYIIN